MTSNAVARYGLAARQPLALAVMVVAVAAGLTVALWLLPLGLLAYTAMVYLGARDPQLAVQPAAPPRPSRPRLSSPALRTQLDVIERTQQEIARSASAAGGALARLLMPIVEQSRELVEEAYLLSDKGQTIERYLAGVDAKAIKREIDGLGRQMQLTQDSYTRDQIKQTLAQRQEKLDNVRDLETYNGRIVAQLQHIAASLDNVLADTVRLRTADAASADSATNQVARRLSDLKSDMDTFQKVLDTALSQSGAMP
jgi:cell division septum initiation protein DivIVA